MGLTNMFYFCAYFYKMLINFDAGPAALPQEILQQAADAVLNYNNSGLSILEIPHRGDLFEAILQEANTLVHELLGLGADYEVLWMQGGGRLQFSMVPMNFLAENQTAGYIESGHWASQALKNAQLYGNTQVLASSIEDNFRYIPTVAEMPSELSYVHITTNNTIYGTQFETIPSINAPLVADMSSELFSRKLDYSQFDLIYAVAQKNIGPSGVTLVVVKKSMLEKQVRKLPEILSYKEMAKHNSLLNTPPVFAIYVSLLMLRWVKQQGMDQLDLVNKQKATLLYNAIDNSKLFYGVAEQESRSNMNVCFRAYDDKDTNAFLAFAKERGMVGIKGHRSVGGFRASLYNAITLEQVQVLVKAIQDFEAQK